MDAYTYLMLGLFTLAGLAFALSLGIRLSSLVTSKPRVPFWASIFGGSGFLLLGSTGMLSLPYLEGSNRLLVPAIAAVLMFIGLLQVLLGLQARRAASK